MRGFLQVLSLELKSLVRSKTTATLLALTVLWMFALPHFVRGDGTSEGARELLIRFSLGGAFVLMLVTLLSSAAGALAHERTSRRLQLTMVRPVRYAAIVLGKAVAHVAVGALVLAAACVVLAIKVDLSCPCHHVLTPVLPSVQEEAREMYASYLRDPQTPDAVRMARRDVVLRLLENRALDHYQTVPTNATATWTFPLKAVCLEPASRVQVRMRFAAQFDSRQDVRGEFRIGPWQASVSNITQAVVTMPLARANAGGEASDTLSFRNRGREPLMLRPRRDLALLVSADGFGCNLLRAYAVLLTILALVVSCGLFLSAGLGRPVALFVAFVTLVVGELAPSVIDSYPDELETNVADRIGLVLTRAVRDVTRPLSSASPLDALSKDERIEPGTVVRCVLQNVVVLPVVLSLLSALVLPRKQGDGEVNG